MKACVCVWTSTFAACALLKTRPTIGRSCQPESVRQGNYSSSLSLGDDGILGGSCDCKSGARGTCQHVAAVAYH